MDALLEGESGGSDTTDLSDIAEVLAAEDGAEWSDDTWIIDEDDELTVPGFTVEDADDEAETSDDEIVLVKKSKRKVKVVIDDEDEEVDELLQRGIAKDEVCCNSCFLIVPLRRMKDLVNNMCDDCA
jgi:hypothetical protein